MKKILTLLLSSALILTFASCNTQEDGSSDTDAAQADTVEASDTENTVTEDTKPATEPSDSKTYSITLDNGAVISIGSYSEESVNSLGTPIDVMEAPSCIHEGFDKVYTFDGFAITTSPDEKGGQYLAEFTLLSDLVAFESGLTVGSPADMLEGDFGDTYEEQFGVRTYKLDSVNVSVIVDGDTVSGITVSAAK